MKKIKLQSGTIIIFFLLILSGITVQGLQQNQLLSNNQENEPAQNNNDFYFIQITDTHVINKIFDWKETSKKRLQFLLNHISSFEKKPAFIVITGDLTEWGGNKISGALNCIEFTNCFYKKNNSLYADENYSIPVFTTPGNHDYSYNRNLTNYLRFINPVDRYIIHYQNISLFFMNSGPNYFQEVYNWFDDIKGDGLYDEDIIWLTTQLEECNTSIKIVLMHHPAVNTRETNGQMWEVLARNRETFITLCEQHNVEVVLAGHTHQEKILDGNETFYSADTPLNCSLYPTLFVQTDDCKQSIHYRNITISGSDVWLEHCEEVIANFNDNATIPTAFQQFYIRQILMNANN